jgi:predicted SAM-dependent methyltransferase
MPTQAFTLIHLLHHLSSFREQEELLKRCYENLTAGGILLVLEIDKRPLWKFGFSAILDNLAYPGHKFYFRNRGELNSILKAAGFRAIRTFPLHRGVPLSHILYVAQK